MLLFFSSSKENRFMVCVRSYTPTQKGVSRFRVHWEAENGRKSKIFYDLAVAEAFAEDIRKEETNRRKRKRNDAIHRQMESNQKRRAVHLTRNGSSMATEAEAIVLIDKHVRRIAAVRDGAHADIAIEDEAQKGLYRGIQVKATQSATNNKVHFSHVNHYPDLVVICVLLNSERGPRFWVFHGQDLVHLKLSLCFSSSNPDSKYAKNEVALCDLEATVEMMLERYPCHPLQKFDEDLCGKQLIEHVAHKKWMEHTGRKEKQKEVGQIENGVVDCIIDNGIRVQEKVCSTKKETSGLFVHSQKHAGIDCRGKNSGMPYHVNDVDMFHVMVLRYADGSLRRPNDDPETIRGSELIGYFAFSAKELEQRNIVSVGEGESLIYGQKSFYCYLPDDVCQQIGWPLTKQKVRYAWTKDHFHSFL